MPHGKPTTIVPGLRLGIATGTVAVLLLALLTTSTSTTAPRPLSSEPFLPRPHQAAGIVAVRNPMQTFELAVCRVCA
eukprot:1331186-Rhodomonas_salina.1